MPQTQTMTLDEKYAILHKAMAAEKNGNRAEYERLTRSVPMPPYLAKVIKEKVGLDCLLNLGWNLSEVEAEYGSNWLCN